MKTLEQIEREAIIDRFNSFNHNLTQTAISLKIGIRTLQRKLEKFGFKRHASTRKVIMKDGREYKTMTEAFTDLFGYGKSTTIYYKLIKELELTGVLTIEPEKEVILPEEFKILSSN